MGSVVVEAETHEVDFAEGLKLVVCRFDGHDLLSAHRIKRS